MEENKYKAFRDSIKYKTNNTLHIKGTSRKKSDEDPYKEERERSKSNEDEREQIDMEGENEEINENAAERFPYERWFKNEKNVEMFIEKMIKLEAAFLNIKTCDYKYENLNKNILGVYNKQEKIIYVNSGKLLNNADDYKRLLNTIIHEIRHRYQIEAMRNPDDFPETKNISATYLEFSDITYPRDKSKKGYRAEYWANGLEEDARAYAAARTEQYIVFTPEEILMMDIPPKNMVTNQILMIEGTTNKQGVIAPITVGENNFSNAFSRYLKKQEFDNCAEEKKGDNEMAAREGTMNLSEGAREQALKVYGYVIEDIQSLSEGMVEKMRERIKDHPSKQLDNMVNTFIGYYHEKLPLEIKDAIDKWRSSENSIVASLRKEEEGASEASVEAAKRLEGSFGEVVVFRNIQQVKTDSPINVDKMQMLADADYIHGCIGSIDDRCNRWRTTMQQYSEQNAVYAPMEELVVLTFNHVKKVYDAAENDIRTKIVEGFEGGRKTTITGGQNAGNERGKEILNIRDVFSTNRTSR